MAPMRVIRVTPGMRIRCNPVGAEWVAVSAPGDDPGRGSKPSPPLPPAPFVLMESVRLTCLGCGSAGLQCVELPVPALRPFTLHPVLQAVSSICLHMTIDNIEVVS